jgi:PAS domain S-box-containing protein
MTDEVLQRHAHDTLRLQAQMLDQIGQAVIATDLTGTIIYANRAAYLLYRWESLEVLGRNILDVTPAEGMVQKAAEIMDMLRSGESWSGEFMMRRSDDHVFPALVTNSPVFDHQRNLIGIIGISSDITALKKAEQGIAHHEAMLESAACLADLGFWDYDMATGLVEWSEGLLRIFGITREQFSSNCFDFLKFIHPDDLESVRNIHKRAIAEGASVVSNYRIVRPDGEVRYIESRGNTTFDDDGKAIHRSGVSMDVTDRKKAEERVAHQQSMLECAARFAAMGSWDYDLVTDMLHWSDETRRIFGVSKDFPISFAKLFVFIHPDDAPAMREQHERSVTEGAPMDMEYRIRRPDGEVRYVHTRGETVRDANGKALRRWGMVLDITERKRAEAALRDSEQRLRQLADNVNAVFWIIEWPTGNVIYINPAYEKIWGKSCRSLMEARDSWMDSVHPQDSEALATARSLLPTGDYDQTYRIVRPDGQVRWIRDRAFPVKDALGNVYRIVGTASDMTERKRAEQQWSVLSRLGRALNMASSAKEAGKVIVEAADELFGWDAATLDLYDEATDIVASIITIDTIDGQRTSCQPAQHWVRPSARARTVLKGGAQLILRKAEDMPDTKSHMFGDTSRPSRSLMLVPMRQGMHTVGILSVQSYRTNAFTNDDLEMFQMFADYGAGALNRIAAEEERHRTEQRLLEQAALLDIAHDAILVKDLEDRIIYWNKGAERTYGWTALDAVGCKATMLQKDHAKYAEALDGVLKHGEWVGDMANQTKDGRELIVQVRWTLVRDKQQNPKAILAINTDITEQKKLESQILRGQRLESIGTLAGGIAHDLNNVLAPILMSVQMLRSMVKTSDGQQILDTLQASSQRGADLIRQVLSFARGVEGKRGPVNCRHLVRDIEKVVHDTFPKNIRFDVDVVQDLWTIEADPTHIHQVLMNLCVNARDAMPDGGTLTVTFKNMNVDTAYARMNPDGKAGPYVVLTVDDTGAGIPASIRDKIFDPFFTTKEVGKGTGLGLATVLTIVKSHHGFINVYSEPNKGARFRIYLPANPDQVAAEQVVNEQNQLPRGNGELVLIVDDEDAIRSITEQTLACFGYRTIAAANGAEAVALYAQQPDDIAVVLTDMMMPVMDGPAAIVALRAINPNVKVIGSSGLGSQDGPARSISAGVHDFVAKPYTAERLLKSLDKLIHNRL